MHEHASGAVSTEKLLMELFTSLGLVAAIEWISLFDNFPFAVRKLALGSVSAETLLQPVLTDLSLELRGVHFIILASLLFGYMSLVIVITLLLLYLLM